MTSGRLGGVYETWHQWRTVRYGLGALTRLGDDLERLGIRRPMVVTTRSLSDSRGLLGELITGMGTEPALILDDARPHAPFPSVAIMAGRARDAKVDGIVSFGGGSCIDAGKAVALLLAHDHGSFRDLVGADDRDEHNRFPCPALPQVAVPTALSGAEFTNTIGFTDPSHPGKFVVTADAIAPDTIVLDPQATTATPARLWATTGVKTLSDAIELLCCPVGSPVVDALAHRAIRSFASNLELSLSGDPEARLACQMATWLTLFGVRNTAVGTGVGVALRHQIGAVSGCPHGEIASVLLPHVIAFNQAAIIPSLGDLAVALQVPAGAKGDVPAGLVASALDSLCRRLQVPQRLRDIGVRREDLSCIAELALLDKQLGMNPRPADAADLHLLLKAAF